MQKIVSYFFHFVLSHFLFFLWTTRGSMQNAITEYWVSIYKPINKLENGISIPNTALHWNFIRCYELLRLTEKPIMKREHEWPEIFLSSRS